MAGDPGVLMYRRLLLVGFQSAPAIDGGRSFIPHAIPHAAPLFQSAPAIDGGRSLQAARKAMRAQKFQSAPAIDGGRSPGTPDLLR